MSKFYHLRVYERPDLRTDCVVDEEQLAFFLEQVKKDFDDGKLVELNAWFNTFNRQRDFLVWEREEIKSWQYFEVLGI